MTDSESMAGLAVAVDAAIAADSQDSSKWKALYKWFESEFGPLPGVVAGKLLTENKQLSNRLTKELPQKEPSYIVLSAVGTDFGLEHVERLLAESNLPKARSTLIFEGSLPKKLLVYESDPVSVRLATITGLSPVVTARPGYRGTSSGTSLSPPPTAVSVVIKPTSPVVVDDRVRRMVVLAIMSTPAVILVGPPGTGKSTLLEQVIADIRSRPSEFGLTGEMAEAKWVTPEESWSAADLVGGETIVDGELRFRPGYVLDSIREDRWLVLDEANRADMDKIFGGLLTWMEGHTVELGRATRALEAPSVRLEWGDEAECTVGNLQALDGAGDPTEPVRFVAGTEWRLLGTYNALDAQRVFRFGQAIGRRFARVPIPTPTKAQFAEALAPQAAGLPTWISQTITAMYMAHRSSPTTELGPALFLRMPAYLRAAADLPADMVADGGSDPDGNEPAAPEEASSETGAEEGGPTTAPDDGDLEPTEPEQVPPENPSKEPVAAIGGEPLLRELVVEAYLVNVGSWLSRLEQLELDELGSRLVVAEMGLSKVEWDWVVSMTKFLG